MSQLLQSLRCVRAIALLGIAAASMAGCTNSNTETATSNSPKTETRKVTVTSAIESLQPLEFEFQVQRDAPAEELNGWGEVILSDLLNEDVTDAKLTEALQPYLHAPEISRVLRREFVPRDAVALRDAIWARGVAESVMKSADNEQERILRLFQFVTQAVHLVTGDRPPLTLFESLQLGVGSAEDRAWIFALLAQQFKMPTVIVEPKSNDETAAPSVFVGVLSDSKLYLFDASVGLPIPGPTDNPKLALVNQVATLQQVIGDDSLLRALDYDGNPYPYQAEQFKAATLKVIGDTSSWSRRFEGLQNGMTAESTAVIYQPLVSVGDVKGVIQEVAEAVKDLIPADKVTIWPYPEDRREKRESLSADEATALKDLFAPFQAPRPLILIPKAPTNEGEEVQVDLSFGPGWNTLKKARTEQLVGQHTEAIPKFLSLQGWSRLPPVPPKALAVPPEAESQVIERIPDDIKALHGRAAEMALFWRASTQLQLGRFGTAASDFEVYLTRVGNGSFPTQAQYLAGVATALDGRLTRAIAFLTRIGKNDPNYRAARYLQRRWKAATE